MTVTVFDSVWALAGYVHGVADSFVAYITGIVGMQVKMFVIVGDILFSLPVVWTAPVFAGLTAVFALKIYGFIKDLSLNGWKV